MPLLRVAQKALRFAQKAVRVAQKGLRKAQQALRKAQQALRFTKMPPWRGKRGRLSDLVGDPSTQNRIFADVGHSRAPAG